MLCAYGYGQCIIYLYCFLGIKNILVWPLSNIDFTMIQMKALAECIIYVDFAIIMF